MMPDCNGKKRWDKENVLYITTKLFVKTDQDIIMFLEGKQKSTTIKVALREYISHHEKEEKR